MLLFSWQTRDELDVSVLWIVTADLVLESTTKRPTLAKQCGILLSKLNEGIISDRFKIFVSEKLIGDLKQNGTVQSLAILTASLNTLSQKFSDYGK